MQVTTGTQSSDAHEQEVSVLLYNADGVVNNCTQPSVCNLNVSVNLHGVSEWISKQDFRHNTPASSGARVCITHFRIDQTHGNPRALWSSFGGAANPYPSAEQFAMLRNVTELDVLTRTFVTLPTGNRD